MYVCVCRGEVVYGCVSVGENVYVCVVWCVYEII